MTGAEWWAATKPDKLIDWLFFEVASTERKLRLFCAACCKHIRHLICDEHIAQLLLTIEAFAAGLLDATEMLSQFAKAWDWEQNNARPRSRQAEDAAFTIFSAAGAFPDSAHPGEPLRQHRDRDYYERFSDIPYPIDVARSVRSLRTEPCNEGSRSPDAEVAQVRPIHDIFGPLPFRDVPIAPEWLTSDVTALARGIYEDKAFDRMPVLADALQDAGCDNEEVLAHCRGDGPHVRGCWVVDLLLGRPWREAT